MTEHRGHHTRLRRRRDRRRTQRRPLPRWAVYAIGAGLAILLIFAGVTGGVVLAVGRRHPDLTRIYTPPSQASRIYAANGEVIASLYRENRATLTLDKVPKHVWQAVIAIEDSRFFEHRGVDIWGIGRAVWHNVRSGEVVEGGSTITQQLARAVFLSRERAISRKMAEMVLALEIERRLTKEEILERYLDEVYFGEGAYGIEMAGRVYFGKPAQELTIAEGAMLAGLIRAPSAYSPYRNLKAAQGRQRIVLDRMVALRMISRLHGALARSEELTIQPAQNSGLIGMRAPYFVSYVLPTLLDLFGEDVVYRGGLQIYTTLDTNMQALAEKLIVKGVDRGKEQELDISEGALVSVDPRNGQIKAMVGGYDFQKSQFNRAWQARRQPGSSFKPFIYITALAHGLTPSHKIDDAEVEYNTGDPDEPIYKPKNYDEKFRGEVTLRYAVEHSINVPAIRVLNELGPDRVIEYAKRMGITSQLKPNLSLALGTSEVTPLEMAAAYGVLATLGTRADPYAIVRITDSTGKVLYEAQPRRQEVLSPAVAYLMTDILKGVMIRGTGTAAAIGRPAAGKTGTTDDYRNAWFIGYTPELSTAVWMGNDDNSPMKKVVGGGLPAWIWGNFMIEAVASTPAADWEAPEGLVIRRGELYIRGTEPDENEVPQAAPPIPGGPGGPVLAPPSAPPAPFLAIDSPVDGSTVHAPFLIEGRAPPRTAVGLVITAEAALVAVKLVETYVPVDDSGSFSFDFAPSMVVPGVHYTVTVTVTVPTGGTATQSIIVMEAPRKGTGGLGDDGRGHVDPAPPSLSTEPRPRPKVRPSPGATATPAPSKSRRPAAPAPRPSPTPTPDPSPPPASSETDEQDRDRVDRP